MNVTELARQLNTTREQLLEKLPEMGFDVGMRAIKVDNLIAERIKKAWAETGRKERLKEKMERQQQATEKEEDTEDKQSISVPEKISVTDLAQKLNTEVPRLIGYLMKNGIMASLNQDIDFETASIVAEDYGFKAAKEDEMEKSAQGGSVTGGDELRELKKTVAEKKGGEARPPVVVVMGHVDHGKTTLLDAIRKTNVVEGESGGITQHIGAYQVEVPQKEEPKSRVSKASQGISPRIITFLDTPGHEAFKAMRERGGQVADVAILVVAADDGLKPQTLESINVIQKEGIPFVVAINKIDKPGAEVDRVKKELAEINLNPEDWGGKTIVAVVSAKDGTGIHELLDMVLLVADLESFTADPKEDACGVIIESHVDRGEGPVATVLIHSGTLRIGDEVVIGETFGKIKALKDWKGSDVAEATPSTPVKILGLKNSPSVGDILKVGTIGRAMRKQASKRHRLIEIETKEKAPSPRTRGPEEEHKEHTHDAHEFSVIVKADVLGSLEALLAAISELETKETNITILKQGLGNITESDLTLAKDAGAVVYGFNVAMSPEAQKMSYDRKVEILQSKIIYEILDDIKERLKKFVKTEIIEVPQGELEILKVFKDARAESIIGGRVKKAKITKDAKFRLMRGSEPIDEGKIIELQVNKQAVDEVAEGTECGMKVSGVRGFLEGDMLACYIEEERTT